MLPFQSLALAFTLLHIILAQESPGQEILSRSKRETFHPLVVDVMFVCDKDFSDYFGQDRQKIIDYLAVWMWDVNLRFKTLTSIDISFRVTNLKIITDAADQPFVEEASPAKPESMTFQMHGKFSEWAFANEANFPNSDIFVLLTRKPIEDKTDYGSTYHKSACTKSAKHGLHLSTFVINHNLISSRRGCGLLERLFAQQLGAPLDVVSGEHPSCKPGGYILGTFCTEKRHFFSECSDKGIFNYVRTGSAACLRQNDPDAHDVLLGSASILHPPTLTELCVLETGDATAIGESDNLCVSANCYVKADGAFALKTTLQILDNTQCGMEKYCFRGRCLQQGYPIQNMGMEKCLHPSSRFSSNDFLTLFECKEFPTPLDAFILRGNVDKGWILATPYATPSAHHNQDKCVSVDVHWERLQYQKCDEENEIFRWDFVKINDNREILLFHRESKLCARVDENNEIRMRATCNLGDYQMRWKFSGSRSIPLDWLKTIPQMTDAKIEGSADPVLKHRHHILDFPAFKLKFNIDHALHHVKVRPANLKMEV